MTMIKRIPLMYHPTNVVFLDDDPKFLHSLCMNLDLRIPYVEDTDPDKIMHYLKTHTYKQDALSALIVNQVFDDHNNKPGSPETFAVDFSQLLTTLTSPTRFKQSVFGMFDRSMKQIDGIDFCRSIREAGLPIKIHLFTGQTTTDEAVQLFNEKIIDGFLVKGGDYAKLAEKINAVIFEYTWRQFVDLGESLSGLMFNVLKPLQDEQFFNVFQKIREKNHIIEFYLLDSSCSFLLIDADGVVKQLFVRNESDFKDCYEITKDAKAPYDVIQAIRGYQQFPYTKKTMGYANLKDDQWENAMVQMDKVPGRELYYAVVDRPDIEVYSFNRYMQEEWPKP